MWNVKKRRFKKSASFLSTPTSTSHPAFFNFSIPFPATRGLGSVDAITTRGILFLIIKSEQGGVLPKWLQGSNET